MGKSEYPKLHLPLGFHEEGWDGVVELKQWFAAGFVELADGSFVRPTFITLDRINGEMCALGRDFHYESEAIVVRRVSIQEIRRLLPILDSVGVFSNMFKYDRIEWNEYE